MSFFGRIVSTLIQDHAVDKLAQNKAFQAFAVKTVDGLEEVKKKAEEVARKAAENPEEAAAAAKEQAATFWDTLKAEAKRDIEAFIAAQRDPPPSTGGTAGSGGAKRRVDGGGC